MRSAARKTLLSLLPAGWFLTAPPLQDQPPDIAFQDRVNRAIDKGAASLKGKRTGSYHQEIENGNELILLTLLHAGVPESDPDVQELLKYVLESRLEKTYKVALTAMCLEELDRVKYQGRIHQCAQFLADNVSPKGLPRYGAPTIHVETSLPCPRASARTSGPPRSANSPPPRRSRRPPSSGKSRGSRGSSR